MIKLYPPPPEPVPVPLAVVVPDTEEPDVNCSPPFAESRSTWAWCRIASLPAIPPVRDSPITIQSGGTVD